MTSVIRLDMLAVFQVDKGPELWISPENDMASAAAVTSVRASVGHVKLTAKGYMSVAALTGFYKECIRNDSKETIFRRNGEEYRYHEEWHDVRIDIPSADEDFREGETGTIALCDAQQSIPYRASRIGALHRSRDTEKSVCCTRCYL